MTTYVQPAQAATGRSAIDVTVGGQRLRTSTAAPVPIAEGLRVRWLLAAKLLQVEHGATPASSMMAAAVALAAWAFYTARGTQEYGWNVGRWPCGPEDTTCVNLGATGQHVVLAVFPDAVAGWRTWWATVNGSNLGGAPLLWLYGRGELAAVWHSMGTTQVSWAALVDAYAWVRSTLLAGGAPAAVLPAVPSRDELGQAAARVRVDAFVAEWVRAHPSGAARGQGEGGAVPSGGATGGGVVSSPSPAPTPATPVTTTARRSSGGGVLLLLALGLLAASSSRKRR